MKSFFKFLFIFFMMVITFCLEPSDFHIKEIQTLPSIQAGVKEEVVLVSNSLYSDSIYTCQDETNQNSFGHTQPAILFNFNENIYTKNITRSNGSFIHNLSTNKLKVQQIRAP